MISERTDPFMNSLETFTNQLIQHGTDLGAKLLSALVVLVIGHAGAGGFVLLDVDEPRFAAASRTMLASGD